MRKSYIRETLHIIYEDGTVINDKGSVMTSWKETNTGYLLVRPERRGTCYRLHRILAECFIPNPENYKYVLHKDDIKDNNSLDNLYWGTNSQNTQEGYDNGCYQYKQRSYKLFVTCHETGTIYRFKSIRSAAEDLQLNRKNIAAVLKGKKKNTYPYDFEYEMPND